MKVHIFKTRDEAAKYAFQMIAKGIQEGEIRTLGLATGGTPLKLYEYMRNSNLDVSEVVTVNLDEYVGLKDTDEHSYHFYMEKELFSHLNFKKSYLPNGMAEDPDAECERYDRILKVHPVDLQILGIGKNGHIGFNEPGTSFHSKTHIVELTESTREANRRFFEKEEDVPEKAISMGIASIMAAKKIVLLAFGKSKAEAVCRMINGPVDEACPASVLQTHPDVVVIADAEASSLLGDAGGAP
ncbi:glucosamine-6-phosphate deaminase [Weizmannia acidilactici]|uniref:Glucosamine-6-phosphate deaminase n=1 Tax=Weizmannia acidilactici TaxID=2607726 RepID=A0A5J4JEK4_9BACI|nr:glucosamine-6-phosphate deaminase [Weizmannia acidilactici]GER67441.1 glucosamine-6-phosphate deaminase [Weizmannia acidilactici]GER68758.1 glucosamine-6-phosphate deaminase [Weizmannia acidilactici]GER72957.1 glucosamine-6-phosphate deaminase [Weizmannia acidilactici]